jgi:Leucine-rich repeat (LRR) protein
MTPSPEKALKKAAAGAKQLDLSAMKLEQLPDAVRGMTHLEALALGMNSLSSLPDWIGELKNLRYLDLSGPGNPLSAIPDSIGDLINLVSLDLSGGPQLTVLPDSIGNLVNLESLWLRGNRLTRLPASLANLKRLEDIDLRRNALTSLPTWLLDLESLEELDVRYNPFPEPLLNIAEDMNAVLDYLRQARDD